MKKLLPLLLCLLLLTGCAEVYDGPTVTKMVLSETVTEGFWGDGRVAYTTRTAYHYDIYGNQAQWIRYNEDEAIERTMLRYDENGNLLEYTSYSVSGWFPKKNSHTANTYDDRGRVLTTTNDYGDGDESTMTYTYDDEANTVTICYGETSTVQYLDEQGFPVRSVYTDSQGSVMETVYTRRDDGQAITCVTYIDGVQDSSHRYEYDDQGRAIAYYTSDEGAEKLQHRWEFDDENHTMTQYNIQSGGYSLTGYNTDGSIASRQVWDENGDLQSLTLYRYREIRVPAERSETP